MNRMKDDYILYVEPEERTVLLPSLGHPSTYCADRRIVWYLRYNVHGRCINVGHGSWLRCVVFLWVWRLGWWTPWGTRGGERK